MSNVRFLYQGLEGATLTASGGTATGYDVENVKDRNPNTLWRSNATTNDQEFKMQFPVARAANTIVIDGINGTALAAGAATLYVQSSPNGWAWTSRHIFTDADLNGATRLYAELAGGTTTELYWRLVFSDSGGTLAAAPQVGSILIGVRLEPALPYDAGVDHGEKFDTQIARSLDKTPYASQSVDDGIEQWGKLKWSAQSSAVMLAFLNLNNGVRGKLRPFYFVDVDDEIYLVMLRSDVMIAKHNRYEQYDIAMEFEAMLPGTIQLS